MILPNNGKVVIIDDQPEDVKALISALSQEKVPFVYYKEEDLSDLPTTPIENVRLVFLDLQLVADTYVPEKNITSPIKTRLMRIINPKTAYALVIWSTKENTYREALIKDFETEFIDYKPIFYASLPKADILGKPNAMEIIRRELENEISNFKTLNAFLIWESIVNESSGKLTNEIATLYPPDDSWNNKTKFLLYKLAKAYSGKAVDDFSDLQKLKNSLFTLTLTFTDNIEDSINKKIDSNFSDLISKEPFDGSESFNPKINKLLLISEQNDNSLQPGNLYFCFRELKHKGEQIAKDFEGRRENIVQKIPKDKQEEALKGNEKKFQTIRNEHDDIFRKKEKIFNNIASSSLTDEARADQSLRDSFFQGIEWIELNITPLCDYAQKKAELYRILPGLLIKSKFRNCINNKLAYTYTSDPTFRMCSDDYFLLFDFRFLSSVDQHELSKRIITYRLKHPLLSDIQIKLSSHINRAGILFVG